MASIESSAYTAVSENETSSNSANAYQLSPPATSTSGWATGFAQLDFITNPGMRNYCLYQRLKRQVIQFHRAEI